MGAHKIPKEPKPSQPKTLAEAWEEYRQNTIPPTAPNIQLVEMRRAFYFGAYAFFIIQMTWLEDKEEDYEPTSNDLDLMTNLKEEMDEFILAIKAGEA